MDCNQRHKATIELLNARKPNDKGDYFNEDVLLYKLKHPRKPLVKDIARELKKPSAARQGVHSRVIAQLIETPGKSMEENIKAIIENRQALSCSGMNVQKITESDDLEKISKAAQKEVKEGKERDKEGLKFFKLQKEAEFPHIPWKMIGSDGIDLCIELYNARIATFKAMQSIDLTATPERADEMIELDKLNKSAHDELIAYNGTGKFLYIHPLTLLHRQKKQMLREFTKLYKEDMTEFTHKYGVCEQNISRIKSNLKHEGLDPKKREALKVNLARAEMRKEIMDSIMKYGAE